MPRRITPLAGDFSRNAAQLAGAIRLAIDADRRTDALISPSVAKIHHYLAKRQRHFMASAWR